MPKIVSRVLCKLRLRHVMFSGASAYRTLEGPRLLVLLFLQALFEALRVDPALTVRRKPIDAPARVFVAKRCNRRGT